MNQVFVLFNDNDPFLTRVIKAKLKKKLDWEMIITSNYNEAIMSLENLSPHVILTELILNDTEGRSGFDLLDKISTMENLTETKVVVLSDLKQKEDMELAMSKGADYFFAKSDISINEIIEKLQEIIS